MHTSRLTGVPQGYDGAGEVMARPAARIGLGGREARGAGSPRFPVQRARLVTARGDEVLLDVPLIRRRCRRFSPVPYEGSLDETHLVVFGESYRVAGVSRGQGAVPRGVESQEVV